MSHCILATAGRLTAFGFPQPKPEPGQKWYYPIDGQRTLIETGSWHGSKLIRLFNENGCGEYEPDRVAKYGLFLPTISDIIPLIGNNALIKFRKDETGQIWECNIDEGDGMERLLGYHETNPAEAAAMAWLMINENDQSANDWLDSVTNETPGKTFVKPGASGE